MTESDIVTEQILTELKVSDKDFGTLYLGNNLKLEFHQENRTHRAASGRDTSLLQHQVFRPDDTRCVRFSGWNSSLPYKARFHSYTSSYTYTWKMTGPIKKIECISMRPKEWIHNSLVEIWFKKIIHTKRYVVKYGLDFLLSCSLQGLSNTNSCPRHLYFHCYIAWAIIEVKMS